jgi:hypothetical protein
MIDFHFFFTEIVQFLVTFEMQQNLVQASVLQF